MRDESLSLRGSPVRALPRRNRTWGANRVCAQDGCVTRLSIYNRQPYCFAHAPIRYHIPRGRRSRAGSEAA